MGGKINFWVPRQNILWEDSRAFAIFFNDSGYFIFGLKDVRYKKRKKQYKIRLVENYKYALIDFETNKQIEQYSCREFIDNVLKDYVKKVTKSRGD